MLEYYKTFRRVVLGTWYKLNKLSRIKVVTSFRVN